MQRYGGCNEKFDLTNYYDCVNDNKGFYIGRYEIGTTEERTSGNSDATVDTVKSENGIPVIKADVYPYNYITFDQALGLVESMYSSSKFTESLLTSAAWDRTLGWIYETSENKEETLIQLIGDSTDWGNYVNATFDIANGKYAEYIDVNKFSTFADVTGMYTKENGREVLLTTGATKRNSKNNIFDLAGNLEEWTNTAEGDYRVFRGGRCIDYPGNHIPVNRYAIQLSSFNYCFLGARGALYLTESDE